MTKLVEICAVWVMQKTYYCFSKIFRAKIEFFTIIWVTRSSEKKRNSYDTTAVRNKPETRGNICTLNDRVHHTLSRSVVISKILESFLLVFKRFLKKCSNTLNLYTLKELLSKMRFYFFFSHLLAYKSFTRMPRYWH